MTPTAAWPLSVEFLDLHPRDPGLAIVRVVLDREPDASWQQRVLHAWYRMPRAVAAPALAVDGDTLLLAVRDADVEAEVARLDRLIRLANRVMAELAGHGAQMRMAAPDLGLSWDRSVGFEASASAS